jgi:2Fe-2S ferredoxin
VKRHQVTFLPNNVTVEAEDGQSLLEAAIDNDIELEHNCGGNCSCTTCHVIVREDADKLSEMEEEEDDRLEELDDRARDSRLGCQALIRGDITVEIPERDPFQLDGLDELEEFGEKLLGLEE